MKIGQQVNISVMKLAMNTAKMQTTYLTKMLEINIKMMDQSVSLHLGTNVNIRLKGPTI